MRLQTDPQLPGDRLSPRRIARLLRWALAVVFLYSGLVKVLDPQRFAAVIAGFGLLPHDLVYPFALLLPVAEIAIGLGTLFAVRGSLTALTALLLVFMAALAWGIHLGLDIDCGCFGPEDPEQAYKGLKAALLRDFFLLAAVLFVLWSSDRNHWRTGRDHLIPSPKER